MKKKENNTIRIISQFFYGNRSGTEITRDAVDYFLRGDLSNTFNPKEVEGVVRKIIRVPGAEHIVIVYDQTQEDDYVNVEFPRYYAYAGADYLARWGEELKMVVSCEIPELGITLHTRCIACRMDDSGTLQSLEDGDYEKFIHYFPTC